MSINRVVISGNLTRDPELRATQGGTNILTFGMAVNDRRQNRQTGEWEDYANFIDCVLFGSRADSLSRILTKGMKVAVEGKLRYSSWENKEGQRRSKIEVVVDQLDFMSQRNGQYSGGGYAAAAPQPQYQAPAQVPAQPQYQQPAYAQPQPQMAAAAPVQAPASAPAQAAPVAQTPPPADVYDEDIPF